MANNSSRRHVIAGLAASPIMAAPAIAATDNPDAALLALFDEWKRASAARDAALDLAGDAEEAIAEYNTTLPEVCKYRPNLLGHRYKDPRDSDWSDLSVLTDRKASGSQFQASAYETMRRFAVQNEWFQDDTVWSSDGWHAPYSPPLKARVAEILTAYDPWNAEREKLKARLQLDTKENAAKDAIAQVNAIELKIARTRAFTEAGWRAKAVIIFNDQCSIDFARARFLEKLDDPDENTIELIEASLQFDFVPASDAAMG